MTDHLDLDDVGYLAGGAGMIRDEGLLLSALGRPQQSVHRRDGPCVAGPARRR
ncbi:hypothetical protein [Kitasatospora sp. P5_F3]